MSDEKKYLFDDPKNIKHLLHILYGCCALLVVLDFVIHRHVSHSWENLWVFYPLYGFIGCVILVVVATWMRTFLMRSEDYYDNEGQSSNSAVNSRRSLTTDLSIAPARDQTVKKGECNVDD
ncbi:MAG: hypothetical protein COB83_11225 [Gammaproteobacteria bacterium]|nr:MAG: hypothetical protein COB83_11225 [Gammaproteobacteria bacterium]